MRLGKILFFLLLFYNLSYSLNVWFSTDYSWKITHIKKSYYINFLKNTNNDILKQIVWGGDYSHIKYIKYNVNIKTNTEFNFFFRKPKKEEIVIDFNINYDKKIIEIYTENYGIKKTVKLKNVQNFLISFISFKKNTILYINKTKIIKLFLNLNDFKSYKIGFTGISNPFSVYNVIIKTNKHKYYIVDKNIKIFNLNINKIKQSVSKSFSFGFEPN